MQGAWFARFQNLSVLQGSIPLVTFKFPPGQDARITPHSIVPALFGQNRGGRDADNPCVALNDRFIRNLFGKPVKTKPAVHEKHLWCQLCKATSPEGAEQGMLRANIDSFTVNAAV